MDGLKTPKIAITVVLLLISALYFIAVFSFFVMMSNETIAAVLTFGSYLTIMAIIWGYGFKVRLPGSEISFYPVENVMRQPYTIQEGKTGRVVELKFLPAVICSCLHGSTPISPQLLYVSSFEFDVVRS